MRLTVFDPNCFSAHFVAEPVLFEGDTAEENGSRIHLHIYDSSIRFAFEIQLGLSILAPVVADKW